MHDPLRDCRFNPQSCQSFQAVYILLMHVIIVIICNLVYLPCVVLLVVPNTLSVFVNPSGPATPGRSTRYKK